MPNRKYASKSDLLIEPKVARELLSQSIARTFKQGEVTVADYHPERLSYYHGKSVVHKVGLTFDFPAEIFDVPPVVVVKTYSDNPQNVQEYMAERKMLELADNLTCKDGDRTVRVYPRYYGREVPECIPHRTLIREYVPQESLMKIVLDKRGKNEAIRWTDINGTISPIALLHTNSPWIEPKLGADIMRFTGEYLGENLVKHIERIARFSGRELSKDLKEKLLENLQFITGRYLFGKELSSVINGDLSVCPHHTTNSVLLDAGGTCIGPITDDLSLYSDFLFEGVLDENGQPMGIEARGKAAVKEYIEKRKRFAEILHYQNDVEKRLPKDFLLTSWLVIGGRGNIRGSSLALAYKYSDSISGNSKNTAHTSWTPRFIIPTLGQPIHISSGYLEQEVNSYIHNVMNILKILKSEDGKVFGTLESLILQSVPEDFKIDHDAAKRLMREMGSKLAPNRTPYRLAGNNNNKINGGKPKGTGSLGMQTPA